MSDHPRDASAATTRLFCGVCETEWDHLLTETMISPTCPECGHVGDRELSLRYPVGVLAGEQSAVTTWDVFRETPTADVWACMGRNIAADSGRAAIEKVTADLPDHLLGRYFAIPDTSVEVGYVSAEHHHTRTVSLA